jgi:hypothetical protein
MKTFDLIRDSNLDTQACIENLAAMFDKDEFSLFSFSGYRGVKPLIGRIVGSEFRLHKRRYWRNSFGPVLYGKIVPVGGGAQIQAYWGFLRSARICLLIWLVLVALISVPLIADAIRQSVHGQFLTENDRWLLLVVPFALLAWGFVLPYVGGVLSASEKPIILDVLQRAIPGTELPVVERERTWFSRLG